MDSRLILAALEAREKAYAPYSNFAVGAALLTDEGEVICGVNVENASYGLTMCAERVAIGAAVARGSQSFSAVAIASEGGVTPCGACRQVLAQFGDMEVFLIDATLDDPSLDERERIARARKFQLSSLLPESFTFDGPNETK